MISFRVSISVRVRRLGVFGAFRHEDLVLFGRWRVSWSDCESSWIIGVCGLCLVIVVPLSFSRSAGMGN